MPWFHKDFTFNMHLDDVYITWFFDETERKSGSKISMACMYVLWIIMQNRTE